MGRFLEVKLQLIACAVERRWRLIAAGAVGLSADAAAMGAEAGTKTYEPPIAARLGAGGAQRFFEGEEHRRAAHVAVVAEHGARGVERMGGERGFEGFDDLASAGVGDDAVDGGGIGGLGCEERGDGIGGEGGHGFVEEVAEFSVA